ncbi:ABC transporter substrate-binding protein [Vibrio sp. S11_S32]|uniref:extracellular solute-binding protein n=1 Tax=Vibrio sp. S11_S32 TaxID=2720225 RepID=UPI00168063A9|nr:extracellular solute-binding protein [Vibrio sp. S11_S32]MBD1575123.1 ABC transporter substrate-binding protein [Vibrio sp. S11_S32]
MKKRLWTPLVTLGLCFGALPLSMSLQAANLPTNLTWQTNANEPIFASPDAKFGGTYHTFITSFPQTFRTVGPDANGGFASWTRSSLGLLDRHPNTDKWLPSIASSWALGDDHKTVYFKINPKAKWSDGEPITAQDFTFMMKMMRSKDIVDPWSNDFYTKEVSDIIVYDPLTIAVVSGKQRNPDELMDYVNLQPRPAHFYAKPSKDKNGDGIADDFVRRFNFKSEPTAGPYAIDKINKGKGVTYKHVKDWWGYDIKYYQHRFNVEKIQIKVIRDQDIAFKYFEKGQLDSFALVRPTLWHDKAKGELFDKGYIHKAWAYNQAPTGAGGIWINTAMPLLDNLEVRKGLMYAVDYDGMINKILRNDYVRKPNPMGSGHGEYDNQDIKAPNFDPQLAATYFKNAGFNKIGPDGIRVNDKGQRLSFAVTYSTPAHTPRVAYLREQAKLAGLDLTLNLIDGSSMFKYVLEKKHQLSFHDMSNSKIPVYWQYFASENANKPQTNNFTNFSSPELDKLINAYREEFDLTKKHDLSRQIQAKINDSNSIIPGYIVPYAREGYWRWLKLPAEMATKQTESLFFANGFMGTMSTFWIDEQVKKETKAAMKADKAFKPATIIDDKYK